MRSAAALPTLAVIGACVFSGWLAASAPFPAGPKAQAKRDNAFNGMIHHVTVELN
jgi:hypothetical protein